MFVLHTAESYVKTNNQSKMITVERIRVSYGYVILLHSLLGKFLLEIRPKLQIGQLRPSREID